MGEKEKATRWGRRKIEKGRLSERDRKSLPSHLTSGRGRGFSRGKTERRGQTAQSSVTPSEFTKLLHRRAMGDFRRCIGRRTTKYRNVAAYR